MSAKTFTIRGTAKALWRYTSLNSEAFIMNYWVAYKRGSFSVKEKYPCADRARNRCADLHSKAQSIRIVVAEQHNYPVLPHCLELPPVDRLAG